MKKIILSLLSLLFFLSCADGWDIKSIEYEELPYQAQTFLTRFFPEYEYTDIQKYNGVKSDSTITYKVILNEDILIEFTHLGIWLYASASDGFLAYPSFLDEIGITDFLKNEYPEEKIQYVEKRGLRYDLRIGLTDGRRLAFKIGKPIFLGIEIAPSDFKNNNIMQFIENNFRNCNIEAVTHFYDEKGASIRVWLEGFIFLEFDSADKWKIIKAEKGVLPADIINITPQIVQDYYNSKGRAPIIEMSRTPNSYQISMNNHNTLYVNL